MITVNQSDGFKVDKFPLNTFLPDFSLTPFPFKLRAEVLLTCRPSGHRAPARRPQFPLQPVCKVLEEGGKNIREQFVLKDLPRSPVPPP